MLNSIELKEKLNDIIKEKKTNICFSADFTNSSELLYWIELTAPYICILKTHIDILEDFNYSIIEKIKKLSLEYNFLIFEDRKFGDIGKTFEKQLYKGIYKIGLWADIITIHGICADGMLSYMNSLPNSIKKPSVLIVSQMSSANNLINKDYSLKCYNLATKYNNLVLGFISQNRFIDYSSNKFLFISPGIRLEEEKVSDQKYRNHKDAIVTDGNDLIIVGSCIYGSKEPKKILSKIRNESYNFYSK